jgi:hypothetical protein
VIQLKLLDAFSQEQLDLLPEEQRGTFLAPTRLRYEVVGEVPYGIFGVVYAGMLAREAVVWFVPYPGIRPSWQERKAAKAFNLREAIGFIPLADVHVDNVAANKFAQFFGLKKQYTDGEYHRYSGEDNG